LRSSTLLFVISINFVIGVDFIVICIISVDPDVPVQSLLKGDHNILDRSIYRPCGDAENFTLSGADHCEEGDQSRPWLRLDVPDAMLKLLEDAFTRKSAFYISSSAF
jgi:hypothetical protein